MTQLRENFPNIVDSKGQIHSIYPPTGYITFGSWIYMVPQYKPESILMLGYGGGTTAGLIRLFYGTSVPITAVDLADCSEFNYYDVNLIQDDAKEFVKNCDKFDCVIVDLYREESYQLESFVFTKEFANQLGKIANYIIIHAVKGDDLSAYGRYTLLRMLSLNTKTKYEPNFYYFVVDYTKGNVGSLPIR